MNCPKFVTLKIDLDF